MRSFLGLILALLAWQAVASPAYPPGSLRFQHLNTTQNLSMELVWGIVQDRQGYIWISGQDGARRFDGHRIRHFRARTPGGAGLAHDTIRKLYVDENGTLWLGTRAGLQHYDPATESFVDHARPGLKPTSLQLSVRSLISDGKGGLWVGTADGLQHFDARTGRYESIAIDGGKSGARSNTLIDIARDPRGRLWIANLGDVIRFDPATRAVRRFPADRCHRPSPDAPATNPSRLLADGDTLWVSTTTGQERWNTALEDAPCVDLGKAERLADAHILSMIHDRDGDIWMGVDGVGLVRWRRADGGLDWFEHSDADPHSVGDDLVQTLFQDRSGTLWAGLLTAGVDYVDLASGGFRRLINKKAPLHSISSNRITGIGLLPDSRIWIGTLDAGVNLYDPASGVVQHLQPLRLRTAARLNNGGVHKAAQDRAGKLWLAAETGLFRHDPATGRFEGPRLLVDPAHGTRVLSLHAAPDGMLWGGTRDGLHVLDPVTGAITTFRHDPARADSLSSSRIVRLLRDRRGLEWISTTEGIDVMDPATGRVRRLVHPRFLDNVNQLYEDRHGDVWAALSSGLVRIHPAAGRYEFDFHPIAVEVDSLVEDDAGRMWLGTEGGLAMYDPRTRKTVRFSANDGVIDGTFRPDSAVRTADGTVYIGSFQGGVVAFHPSAIRRNGIAPAVQITGVLIDNQPLRPGAGADGVRLDGITAANRQLRLSPRQSTFAIEFSAMHFSDPARNAYSYRLAGYDDAWKQADASKPFALYGTLPPGEYRFEVRAANKDGVWSTGAATLRVVVTPAFWATAWFRVLAGLGLLTLLWLVYRMRVRLLIRKQVRLEALIEQRTAQVRDTLRELTATQEQLVFREKMASVGTLTAGIAHEINNPANFAHVGAQLMEDDLQQFHDFLRELAGEDADAEVLRAIEDQFARLSERLATIADGTTRIRDLVKDLRTFARLDEAEKKEADLIQCLQSTIQLVRPQFAHTVEFVTDFAAQPRLECWPAQLNQVFMNVIVNACQAIEARQRSGEPAPPGRLSIRSREDQGCCLLEFEDNGCGIAPGVLERIFEPFFTTKDVGSGTGLGLSISFGIVARHNGTITARSTPGQGSCFTIRLPMAPPHPAPRAETATAA